jgi:cyclase
VRFRDHRIAGDILELATRYRNEGADELVFYDIAASPAGQSVDRRWVAQVARILDIPFCVAGGIRSVADAEELLNVGADKVSVNSPALENPTLIDLLARRFGSQCVVVGIDSRSTRDGHHCWLYSGDAGKARDSLRTVASWVREVQERGAGEIVLNSMDSDGVRQGYDLLGLKAVRAICRVPLIASGGAGNAQHFIDVFAQTGVDGALAASVFHTQAIDIAGLKQALHGAGVPVRIGRSMSVARAVAGAC